MIKVHKFVPMPGIPDMSPFVIKVETYLRMTGRPYEGVVGDTRRAPKGKLPFVEHDGARISDSHAILAHFEASGGGLDHRLDARQRALATAVRAMLEEHLAWALVYFRWQDPAGWHAFRPHLDPLFEALRIPALARPVVVPVLRKQWLRMLHGQGTGRHSRDEVVATGARLLDSLEELLDREPFFFGEHPSTLDATMFGVLATLHGAPPENPVGALVRESAKLAGYVDRMRSRYWANEPSA